VFSGEAQELDRGVLKIARQSTRVTQFCTREYRVARVGNQTSGGHRPSATELAEGVR
jgi:hypothetical protein